MTTTLRKAASAILLVLVWAAASRYGPWPSWVVPSPLGVGHSLIAMVRDGSLGEAVARSVYRLGVGYGLSLAIGVPLGMLLGRSRWAEDMVGPVVLAFQSMPSICWLPIALLWFGLSEASILFVVVMGSTLAIAIAAQAGVKNLNPLWIRAARTMGTSPLDLYTTVLFPASLPALLTGAKLGWSFAWRALLAAELLYVSGGLGQLLEASRELNDTSRVFAVMVVIGAIGVAIEQLVFAPIERRVRHIFGLDRG